MAQSGAESAKGASFGFSSHFFPRPGRRGGFERRKKTGRDGGYFIDRSEERCFVFPGRLGKTADLAHELKGSGSNLFAGDGRIEVEQRFDVSAHWPNFRLANEAGFVGSPPGSGGPHPGWRRATRESSEDSPSA